MKTIILMLIYAVSYVIYLILNIVYAPLKAIEKSADFVHRFGNQ